MKNESMKKVARTIGVDKAIFYTSVARMIQGAGGIITVLLVATCLTGVEQGFFYTFASIIAIQVFFELGFTTIITQFVAHEKSHLIEEQSSLLGEKKYISRLSYLLHFCIKWYGLLAMGLLLVILFVGFIFFGYFYRSSEIVYWKIPWILLAMVTTINFLFAPISAFLEGLGKVKEIAFVRLLQQIFSMLLVWIGLMIGLKLYVVFFTPLVIALVFLIYAWFKFRKLLFFIYSQPIIEKISYQQEIFPYQWKIALSWVSGYFIFQIFNPILFAFEGAVVAGQMGMTISALNAILSLSISWITTKIPLFSGYIAQKQYAILDKIFDKALIQSIAINVVGICGFMGVIFFIKHFNMGINHKNLGDRFLTFYPMVIMGFSFVLNEIVFAWATYLRCHKREPMMVQSIIMGILCSSSAFFMCKYFGINGMTTGYVILNIIGFIWTYFIFSINKQRWHQHVLS